MDKKDKIKFLKDLESGKPSAQKDLAEMRSTYKHIISNHADGSRSSVFTKNDEVIKEGGFVLFENIHLGRYMLIVDGQVIGDSGA